MAVPIKSILKTTQSQYNTKSTNGLILSPKSVEFFNHTEEHQTNHKARASTPTETASSLEDGTASLYNGYGMDEYEVEAIVGHKKYKGDYLYLLKWKGYTDTDNTWEPADNLYCLDLLKAYREKFNLIKKKKDRKQSSASKLKLRSKSKSKQTFASLDIKIEPRSEQKMTNGISDSIPMPEVQSSTTPDIPSRVASKSPEPELEPEMELVVRIKLKTLCPCGVLHRTRNSEKEILVHSLWCVSHDHTYFTSSPQDLVPYLPRTLSSDTSANSLRHTNLSDDSEQTLSDDSTEVCDLKLYLSPSPSESDVDPVGLDENSDNERLFQPNSSVCSHMPLKSVQSVDLRWKGPMPLPRSFSKKQSCQAKLRTKAAKVNRKCKDCKNDHKRNSSSEHSQAPLQREAKLRATANPLWKPVSHTSTMPLKKGDRKTLSVVAKKEVVKLSPAHDAKENASILNNGSMKNPVVPVHMNGTVNMTHKTNPSLPIIQISHCEKVDSCRFKPDYAYKEIIMNWQYELNKQRGGTDNIIFVENDVDRVLPPAYFKYTSSNIYRKGVPDPSHPEMANSLCGCECYYLGRKCGPKSEFCCAHMAGSKFAYSPRGKVCVEAGTPIYECNLKCSCRLDCPNRIVQLGRQFPLCIFRTDDRGWGVKATQPIKSNTFVSEYVGEVITNEEAERRGQTCDAQGLTYLFDLDFEDDNSAFTIDAANYGNISHFFNHSCDPNLIVYSVWIDTLDKRLPRLAFFTTRNISTGEELTFDYQMSTNRDYTKGSTSRMKCRCGSKNCLGYID